MASVSTLSLFYPVFVPVSVAGSAYLVRTLLRVNWYRFFTGPGRTSRILLLFFVLTNWKSMPLAWTIRIFATYFRHGLIARLPPPPHRALFHYSISLSRTPLLETDYNMHKSNSTYFSDLDVSRSHLVTALLGKGFRAVAANARTHLVHDREGRIVQGPVGIGLGAVFCSFRREIAPYAGYEMWTRVLAWDRKWLYIVTHFVVAGKVKPTGWDWKPRWWSFGSVRGRRAVAGATVAEKSGSSGESTNGSATGHVANGHAVSSVGLLPPDLDKHVIATAISKYVFKLGRFTVHPAIVIEASGLLPERLGEGWRGGESGVGTPDDLGDVEGIDSAGGEWDWRRTEYERRRGMAYAEHFAALDGTGSVFDGGEDGALGRWALS